jgi:hypothetical protein
MPTIRNALRVITPLLLVLSLAGCFKSSAPLLDAAQAKYPFATLTLKNEEGQISTVKRDGDVYRFIEDGKQDSTALLIHELGPDLYLVQVATPDGESEYLFAKKQDKQLVVRSDCRGLDPAVLHGAGAEVQESGETIYECHFKDAKGLVELGKSPGIWAASTTTLQIVSIE